MNSQENPRLITVKGHVAVPRPSGGRVYYGTFFIKHHEFAMEEAQLLGCAAKILGAFPDIHVPEPVLVTKTALVLPYLKPAETPAETTPHSVEKKALQMVETARWLHSRSELFGWRICSEKKYRDYVLYPDTHCWDGEELGGTLAEFDAHRQYLRQTLDELGPVVAKATRVRGERFVHGDFTFSNCYYLEEKAEYPDHKGCLVDLSVKASPGLPEVDLSKILFSCLGFDTTYYKDVVDRLVGPDGMMQRMYVDPIDWKVVAYFLASHVLRVSRREPLSIEVFRRASHHILVILNSIDQCVTKDSPPMNLIFEDSAGSIHSCMSDMGLTPDRTVIITDMDGTLIDSYVATVNAYAKAGFDFKPEYWGKSASDIGIPPEAHQRKLALWPDYVPQIKLLRMARELADIMKAGTPVILLTGASEVTTKAGLKRMEPVLSPSAVIHGCGRDAKIAAIHSLCLANPNHNVIYVDDDKEFLELLMKRSHSVNTFHVHNLRGEHSTLNNLILFHANSPCTIETPRSIDS